jgi:hypothetical protein
MIGVGEMFSVIGAGDCRDDPIFLEGPIHDPGQGAKLITDDIKDNSFFDFDADHYKCLA